MRAIVIVLLSALRLFASGQSFQELDSLANGHPAEALALAKELLSKNSSNAHIYEVAGLSYMNLKQWDSAEPYFQRAVALDHDSSFISGHAYVGLGWMYGQKWDSANAIRCLNKAIELNKDSASVRTAKDLLISWLQSEQRYDEVKAIGYGMMQLYRDDADLYQSMGRMYLLLADYDSSIYCDQQCVLIDSDKTSCSAWGYADMADAYLKCGEKDKAIAALNKMIALNKTNNSLRHARRILDSLDGKSPQKPHWVVMEGIHIRYYFQDTTGMSRLVVMYIAKHEAAYEKINTLFQATLPNKMTFYVWNDTALARQILGSPLGFTNSRKCITNAAFYQTVGHEMTHTLSYWGWGYETKTQTQLINEGVAVAFNQSLDDKYLNAKKAIAGEHIPTVIEIWKNSDHKYADVVYPIGGAFVTYLFEQSTAEQFKSIIKDQTIEHAEQVYGKETFAKMVAEFDEMIGLGK